MNLNHLNPFWDKNSNDGMDSTSVAYRYQKFDLDDNIQLTAGCELHELTKNLKKADTSKIVTKILVDNKKRNMQPMPWMFQKAISI